MNLQNDMTVLVKTFKVFCCHLNIDLNFLTFHTFEIVQGGKFTLKQSTNYKKCIEYQLDDLSDIFQSLFIYFTICNHHINPLMKNILGHIFLIFFPIEIAFCF